jgi:hypothetical protein
MVSDAFPDMHMNEAMVSMVVDSLLTGCLDKTAAIAAMDRFPSSLDEAYGYGYVKSSIQHRYAVLGKPKIPSIRSQVSGLPPSDSDPSDNETNNNNSKP